MGEDQDAAGARRLDEAERRDCLAGAGGVLEPEAPVGVRVLGHLLDVRVEPPGLAQSCGSSSSGSSVLVLVSSSSPGIAAEASCAGSDVARHRWRARCRCAGPRRGARSACRRAHRPGGRRARCRRRGAAPPRRAVARVPSSSENWRRHVDRRRLARRCRPRRAAASSARRRAEPRDRRLRAVSPS